MWSRLITSLFLVISVTSHAAESCHGSYRGQTLSRMDVQQLLAKKQSDLNLCGANLANSNLSNLNLAGVNLTAADLSHANLSNTRLNDAKLADAYLRWAIITNTVFFQADLTRANLQETAGFNSDFRNAILIHADLNGADLTRANFIGANLTNAFIANADLPNANFSWATLTDAEVESSNVVNAKFERAELHGTNFTGSDLTNSEFQEADLTSAVLRNTSLKDAKFFAADFQDVLFQPKLNELPDLLLLVHAKNFHQIRFHQQKGMPALTQLRKAYAEMNLRKMERLITSMIKTKQMHASFALGGFSHLEAIPQYFLFYLPCQYGASPLRPLQIFIALVFLSAIPYAFAIRRPMRTSGFFVKWSAQPFQTHRRTIRKRLPMRRPSAPDVPIRNHLRTLRIALYFSLINALQIGWRRWNISQWISRMQGREYTISSLGWVRVVAGTQSIISAYLLILWLVTYFGHPFEW